MALKAKAEFTDRSQQFEVDAKKVIANTVKKAGYILEGNIKKAATDSFNQQTGNLRRSISYMPDSDPFVAEVGVNPMRGGADVNYAIFLEYGTRYIAPRAFMYKGAKRSEVEIKKLLTKKMGDIRISGNIKP